MNVILAIVISMNCYFRYLEQLENKMHLNVPQYNNNSNNNNNNNNNNKIIHYFRTSSLSLNFLFVTFRIDQIILINHKLQEHIFFCS